MTEDSKQRKYPQRIAHRAGAPVPPMLGRRVASLRALHNWDQHALAKAAGISQASVSSIETGASTPSLRTLMALAECLGASADYLLYGIGAPQLARPAEAVADVA